MIAVFFGAPGASGFDFSEVTGDTIRKLTREVRKLTLVPTKLEFGKGANGMLTVAQLCAERKMDVGLRDMARIGRRAAALSRKQELPVERVRDDAFGEVNSYRREVLEAALAAVESEGAKA
jgi:hypothetical protein